MISDDVTTAYQAMLQAQRQARCEAGQTYSQALVRLYERFRTVHGGTLAAFAAHVGGSPPSLQQALLFGRFLDWWDTQEWPRPLVTQKPFLHAWGHTPHTRNEHARFALVATQLGCGTPAGGINPSTPQQVRVAAALVLDLCGDGTWHRLAEIVSRVEQESMLVQHVCEQIVTRGAFQAWGEQRPAPPSQGGVAYRLVKGGGKKVDVTALYTEVRPVLDRMKELVYGHVIHFSQPVMKQAYEEFRQTMDRVMTPTTRPKTPNHRTKDTTHVHATPLHHGTPDPRPGPTVCDDDPLSHRAPVQ